MSNMKTCPNCGEPLATSAKFCPKCGAQFKKPLLKRLLLPIICIVAIVIAVGIFSGSTEKQDALIAYINEDIKDLAKLEEEMLDSYHSVVGSNYTDDYTMYNEITNTTIPLCHELNEKVLEISPSDPEIAEVHNLYRKCVSKYLNAMGMASAALENQDVDQVLKANDLIDEATDLAFDFQQALQKLADERDVVFNK